MSGKKLLLISLVLSSGAVYAGTPDGVKKALANYCVPYSDTNEKGRVFDTPVCASVFEGKYNPSKSGVKCDCYESDSANASNGKFLFYDSNTNVRRCRPQCKNGEGPKKTDSGDCPSGYYKDRIDNPNSGSGSFTFKCEICKAGSYSDRGLECILCPGGYYTNKDGLSTCSICPAGTYSETNGGATKCLPCGPGQFCPEGSSKPSMCPSGQYSPDTKTCKTCPAGYKCPGGILTKCPAGTYQGATGQSSCYDCEAGNYCPEGATKATPCPVGQYSSSKNAGSCTTCKGETWTRKPGASCGSVYYDVTNYCTETGSQTDISNYKQRTETKNIPCLWCAWQHYTTNSANGTLTPGTWKIVLAGAKGGTSADSGILMYWCGGNAGGNGEVIERTFDLSSSASFSASWGSQPSKPGRPSACHAGSNGSNGPNSTFYVNGTTYTAHGGGGGISDSGGCDRTKCKNGSTGTSYGNNSGDGYMILYRYNSDITSC